MREGLLAVSGAPAIAKAWWIVLSRAAWPFVPLSLLTSDKHDSPGAL